MIIAGDSSLGLVRFVESLLPPLHGQGIKFYCGGDGLVPIVCHPAYKNNSIFFTSVQIIHRSLKAFLPVHGGTERYART